MAEKTRVNAMGYLEGFDEETGRVVWVQKKQPLITDGPKKRGRPRGRPTKTDNETHHTILDAAGRKIRVPKGTNPDHIPRRVWPYSEVTCMHVCEKIMEGMTVREIGLLEGYPTRGVIDNWARTYPEFREQLKQARAARAEYFHDEIIEVARNTNEFQNKADRLKIDAYKWVAAVNDPGTYGNQTKLTGDANAPLSFVIETGVRRSGDPGAIPAEFKTIPGPGEGGTVPDPLKDSE